CGSAAHPLPGGPQHRRIERTEPAPRRCCGPGSLLVLAVLVVDFGDRRRLLAVLRDVLRGIELPAFRLAEEALAQRSIMLLAPVALLPAFVLELRVAHGAFLFGNAVLIAPPGVMFPRVLFLDLPRRFLLAAAENHQRAREQQQREFLQSCHRIVLLTVFHRT